MKYFSVKCRSMCVDVTVPLESVVEFDDEISKCLYLFDKHVFSAADMRENMEDFVAAWLRTDSNYVMFTAPVIGEIILEKK